MKKGILGVLIIAVFVSFFLAGPASASEKGKIQILFLNPFPPAVKYMQSVIDAYKKAHPGVEFNLEPLGFGGFMTKVTALKAAGNPPDILVTIPGHMWTFQQKGWLIPMDDVVERLGGNNYFQTLPGFVKREGHYWGAPYSSYSMHLEYRKDLFDKKGLKEPRTWDDLLAAAKALTEDTDGDGKIDRYGIALPLKKDYALGVMFLSFLWGNGGNVLDKEGNVVFNSPETIQTLNFMKEIFKYAPPGVSGYSWMELDTTYIQDKVAITTFSAMKPLADAIKGNPTIAENTRIAAIPTRLANQKPKGRWSNMGWMIMKGSKNIEAAKDFTVFWLQPERMVQYYHVDPIFVVPGEKPVIALKSYWGNDLIAKYKLAVEKMIELNETAVDPAMEHPGILQPNTSVINQRLLVAECVQDVVLGNMPAEKAAAKAQKKMENLIAKQK